MKKIALTLALLMSTLISFSQSKDSDGHTLVALWKTFYKAQKADRPQDQIAALEAIKTEASAKHLGWDFYDAASRYVSVRTTVNWKERSALEQQLRKEIEEFAEPVVVYYFNKGSWSRDKAQEYVRAHKEELLKTFNPEFHSRDGSVNRPVYSPVLRDLIKNDYEYALWSLYIPYHFPDARDYYGTSYPAAAFLDYEDATNYGESVVYDKLANFVKKYEGKAASLLGRQRRLSYEFNQARNVKEPIQQDFIAIRDKCARFEKDRAAFSGSEKKIADCCTAVEGLISTLESKDIDPSYDNGHAKVSLRNVKYMQVNVFDKDEKQVWTTRIDNPKKSYYVRDEVEFDFPDFDDGIYDVRFTYGDLVERAPYEKYTLSLAMRAIADGYGVFVADYWTGKPLEKCDLTLYDADSEELAAVKDFAVDGFTPLPEKFSKYLSKDSYAGYLLVASATNAKGRKCLSKKASLSTPNPGKVKERTNYNIARTVILTDRGAYNPGDVVKFKAILYGGTYEYELAPAGVEFKAELFDAESNCIASKKLKTGDLGSADGEFALKDITRGGMFRLKISSAGGRSDARYIRVDEFVLPTFELTWEPDDHMYLIGEPITVKGKVSAYSGHSLGDVRAYYEVEGLTRDDLELSPDGTFSFVITPKDDRYTYGYHVKVTVADDTGETLEFHTYRQTHYHIPFNMDLRNKVRGNYTLTTGRKYRDDNDWIIRDSFAKIAFITGGLERSGLVINWKVSNEAGKQVASGRAGCNEVKDIDLKGLPSGLYCIEATASALRLDGMNEISEAKNWFVKAEDDDTALDMSVTSFFKDLGGEDIAVQFGSTDGPVWAVVELIGSGNVLLERQMVTLTGERGKAGSLKTISYSRKPSYPETLTLNILYFHKGEAYQYSRKIELPVIVDELPLEFTRFTDLAAPGDKVSLLIKTEPGIECAAVAFDKATETICDNIWYEVTPERRSEPRVWYSTVCGFNGEHYEERLFLAEEGGMVLRKSAAAAESVNAQMMDMDDALAPEREEAASPDAAAVKIRDNFDATMAWEPALRSGADGTMEFNFEGSDRLSTYYVQLFAHGKGMRNATIRKEMKVTIPIKVSVMQPLFLYAGDTYTLRSTVASTQEGPVSGVISVRFLSGDDYRESPVIATRTARLTVPAGGSVPFEAKFEVPTDVPVLGILVKFVSDGAAKGSDAVFVTVPVKGAMQTLTEAHSAVLLAGGDREALIAQLRSLFVNADASKLEPVERDILGMIRDAIPASIEPKSTNVLALTEAYYANVVARRVGAEGLSDGQLEDILGKIAKCQNSSGGISWFEGMSSSPIITAAVLQRIAAMPEQDTGAINVEAAVKFLDKSYFDESARPWWCGGLSLPVYLQTRALYPSVPFDGPKGKELREFKKEVKEYLVPSKARGLNAQILAKARRLRTLQSLSYHPDGKKLAKSWGINFCGKVNKSLDADVESLLQYAVDHRSGGIYYPNAVMPWRGLMESELYAHSTLCDLFTAAADNGRAGSGKPLSYAAKARSTAEGIRLWLMIQKETQKWEDDAAYIEAIASVLRGTPETLATKVILLSTTFTKPFVEVKAAGNGFTVSRQFFCNGNPVEEGTVVKVGDRIVAQYKIWSEENRSFVRLTAPRPASLRPVAQLSGHYGWWLRPLSYGGWSFSPQGYRNVLSDKTEYWFDSYPEEHTTITEEFFVTQEGAFQMPAVEIESLYAPHYRANDDGRGPLLSE